MTKQNNEIIKNLDKTYARIKPSKISGVGVFAIRDIPVGKKIFEGQINQKWFKIPKKRFKKIGQRNTQNGR